MGILNRFASIMSSNVNALLDKMEDPAKMIDQILRDLNSELGDVRSQTAAVMAEEYRAKRELDKVKEESKRFESYAEKAVMAGNDQDALKFLEEKNRQCARLDELEEGYRLACENSEKMRQMHDKLQGQIGELNERKNAIKVKVAQAHAQEKMNKLNSSVSNSSASLSSFDRMEEKANRMLDEAKAKQALNTPDSDLPDTSKYDSLSSANKAEDELAALKERLRGN